MTKSFYSIGVPSKFQRHCTATAAVAGKWNVYSSRINLLSLLMLWGSNSKPSLSWATSVNILQLRSEIQSLHWKSELNLVHSEGSAQARLRFSSGFSELSPEPSQCEVPQYVSEMNITGHDGSSEQLRGLLGVQKHYRGNWTILPYKCFYVGHSNIMESHTGHSVILFFP